MENNNVKKPAAFQQNNARQQQGAQQVQSQQAQPLRQNTATGQTTGTNWKRPQGYKKLNNSIVKKVLALEADKTDGFDGYELEDILETIIDGVENTYQYFSNFDYDKIR